MKPGSVRTGSVMPVGFPLFAHQGGWDEILIVAVPLLLIALLLYVANRRVDAKLAEQSDTEAQPHS